MASKSKAKAKAKSNKKARTVKPVEIPAAVKQAAASAMKDNDISVCEAIRGVAKRFKKVPRRALEAVFVGGHKVNQFTVRRQIQLGRHL